MNILYAIHQFYPEFNTGTEKFLLNLSSALQRDGHFAQIVTYTFVENESYQRKNNLLTRTYDYKGLPVAAIRHHTLPIDINISSANSDIFAFALDFFQRDRSYDLLHIAHPMRMASFALAAQKLGIPYILTLTDYWMICPRIILQTQSGTLCTGAENGRICSELCPDLDNNFLRQRLDQCKHILTKANAVVSPSRFLAGMFKKEFPSLAVQLIPHGMDYKYIAQNSRIYKKGDKIIFAYCGGLSPHKGVHLLIKAFRDIHPENGMLRIYGSCFHEIDYFQYLKKLAGQNENIVFCGTYSEEQVGEVYRSIDVVVLPSIWYENYPLVLHEALACNVPVITSNIGGMAEKIKDSVNGFTFQVGDEQDLGSKLRSVLENPQILNPIKESMQSYITPLSEEEAYMYQRLYKNFGKDS